MTRRARPGRASDRLKRIWLFVGASVAMLAGACSTTFAYGESTVDVCGTFLDADTGKPLPDIVVDAYWNMEVAQRHVAQGRQEEDPCLASAVTATDGALRLQVKGIWCDSYGPFGGPHDLPPYDGVGAIVAWKDGYGRQVIDCTQSKWTASGRHATLDLGEIRLVRAR